MVGICAITSRPDSNAILSAIIFNFSGFSAVSNRRLGFGIGGWGSNGYIRVADEARKAALSLIKRERKGSNTERSLY